MLIQVETTVSKEIIQSNLVSLYLRAALLIRSANNTQCRHRIFSCRLVQCTKIVCDVTETDPDLASALKILHGELCAKNKAILYKQPLAELTYIQASKW